MKTYINPHTLILSLIALCASVFSVGCETTNSPLATPIHEAEKSIDTLFFGLPSTELYESNSSSLAAFKDGRKAQDYKIAPNVYADVTVSGASADISNDGSVSLIRKWQVIHDTFHGEYQIRSGPYYMDFYGKYKNVRPTTAMLRQIFGKWIIFKGDDMARVHEVPSPIFHKALVFNDGRIPSDTYAPDY